MTIARAQLVDVSLARWYHCITRCVRRAFLLGEGDHNRKEWLQNRLQELAEIFAVAVGGFSVMDNHRFESCGRQDRDNAGNKRLHIDQAACGTCRSSGKDSRTASGRRWQRYRLARGGRFGRGAVALSDRRPPRSGFDP
jgi:hypothetical protein